MDCPVLSFIHLHNYSNQRPCTHAAGMVTDAHACYVPCMAFF